MRAGPKAAQSMVRVQDGSVSGTSSKRTGLNRGRPSARWCSPTLPWTGGHRSMGTASSTCHQAGKATAIHNIQVRAACRRFLCQQACLRLWEPTARLAPKVSQQILRRFLGLSGPFSSARPAPHRGQQAGHHRKAEASRPHSKASVTSTTIKHQTEVIFS